MLTLLFLVLTAAVATAVTDTFSPLWAVTVGVLIASLGAYCVRHRREVRLWRDLGGRPLYNPGYTALMGGLLFVFGVVTTIVSIIKFIPRALASFR
jgi:drug/metabolite transporter (DMT)-like permease